MGNTAASGSQTLLGLGREAYPGEGLAEVIRWIKANLPSNMGPVRPEQPSGATNPSGWAERGLPGPVTIPADIGMPMRAADLLMPAEVLMGAPVKSTLETGVYQYLFEPDKSRVFPSFAGIFAKPPTHLRRRGLGGTLDGLAFTAASGTPIMVRYQGAKFLHTTTMGEAVELTDPVSDYTTTPQVRGVADGLPLGAIAFQVKSIDGDGVPTIQYEMLPIDGTPIWPAIQPGYAVQYDSAGRMRWQNMQGAVQLTGTCSVTAGQATVTGVGTRFLTEASVGMSVILENEVRVISAIASDTAMTFATNHTAGASADKMLKLSRDFGVIDRHGNFEPAENLLPGTIADHADLDVGDSWIYPLQEDWDDPTPSYDTAPARVTSSHLTVEYRVQGDTEWIEESVLTAGGTPMWPTTVDAGPGSKYPNAFDRDTEASGTVTMTRRLRGANWEYIQERHLRIELRWTLSMQLIGTSGLYRELIQWTFRGPISVRTAPAAAPAAIVETLNFRPETNDAGDPPFELKVVTPHNYTVATTPAS